MCVCSVFCFLVVLVGTFYILTVHFRRLFWHLSFNTFFLPCLSKKKGKNRLSELYHRCKNFRFHLYKENKDTQEALGLIAKMLGTQVTMRNYSYWFVIFMILCRYNGMVDGSISHIAVVGCSIICSIVHIGCKFRYVNTFNFITVDIFCLAAKIIWICWHKRQTCCIHTKGKLLFTLLLLLPLSSGIFAYSLMIDYFLKPGPHLTYWRWVIRMLVSSLSLFGAMENEFIFWNGSGSNSMKNYITTTYSTWQNNYQTILVKLIPVAFFYWHTTACDCHWAT